MSLGFWQVLPSGLVGRTDCRESGGKSRETRHEATATVQARDDGDLVQGRKYGGGERQLGSGGPANRIGCGV